MGEARSKNTKYNFVLPAIISWNTSANLYVAVAGFHSPTQQVKIIFVAYAIERIIVLLRSRNKNREAPLKVREIHLKT